MFMNGDEKMNFKSSLFSCYFLFPGSHTGLGPACSWCSWARPRKPWAPTAPLIGGARPGESPALCVRGAGLPRACSMAARAAAARAFLSRESRAGGVGPLRAPAPVTMDSFFFGIKNGGDEGGPGVVRPAEQRECRWGRCMGEGRGAARSGGGDSGPRSLPRAERGQGSAPRVSCSGGAGM